MEFVLGGIAAVGAGIFTNPLEVAKTRMQLQGELKGRGLYAVHYRNVFHALYAVAKADGIRTIQNGLVPALWYQLLMNGVRLGAFNMFEKNHLIHTKTGDVSTVRSIGMGAIAGCLGAAVGSPMYLVKTHLQAKSSNSIAVGYQHNHKGTLSAITSIYSQYGVTGLWRGASAAVPRVAVGSAVQLSTFSKGVELVEASKIFPPNSWLAALSASMISGFAVAVCMTPLDVVSTRLYNQGVDAKGRGLLYTGVLDCIGKMYSKEGILGFYKGWTANLVRVGPHSVLCLVFWSQLKQMHQISKVGKQLTEKTTV